jgi:ApaG protein
MSNDDYKDLYDDQNDDADEILHELEIDISTRYLDTESDPKAERYVFAYNIKISNLGDEAVKLLSRYWRITDSNEEVQEVHGEGVVGKQPRIEPGQHFRYSSGAILKTPAGTMEGHYEFIADDGTLFQAPIPAFMLADPDRLH